MKCMNSVYALFKQHEVKVSKDQTDVRIVLWVTQFSLKRHQVRSWRAGVLQSLALTFFHTPVWCLVYLERPSLAASGVFD